ncbi:MAG: DNA gyrase inhibitor YacG [Hyphomicrobiaceae bacterium]
MARRTEPSDRPANPVPAKRGGTCPICATPAAEGFWPFCSKRCADVDLARWLGGAYAIPVAEDDDEDGEEAERPSPGGPAEPQD